MQEMKKQACMTLQNILFRHYYNLNITYVIHHFKQHKISYHNQSKKISKFFLNFKGLLLFNPLQNVKYLQYVLKDFGNKLYYKAVIFILWFKMYFSL